MSRAKVFISILTVLILITLSGASVWAAPGGQEPPVDPTEEPSISGEVQEVRIDVDEETGETTVLVTLVDEAGETQTVRVSVDTAKELGLLQVDEDGDLVLDDEDNPIPIDINPDDPPTVEIDSTQVIEYVDEDGEQVEHPVALALARVFGEELGLDIMSSHENGFGFGVIAQACWMSVALKGDATLFSDILDAKRDHDFSEIDLSSLGLSDEEPPKSWGQFKKAVLGSKKAQKNLGEIMSGRAEPLDGTDSGDEDENENELGATSTQGKVKGKKDKAGGKPEIPPGQVKKSGKPDTSPGQGKNKDKGKGGGKKK